MSLDLEATLNLQREFASHLRDPERFPAPKGLEERRLKIYRELFYNNIERLLAANFPVLRKLLGTDRWHRLVRDFYREHTSHTPLFTEIGREFQRYLETRVDAGRGDLPFLTELAHYEWVELALSLDEHEISAIPHDANGDVLAGVPVPSPLAWSFSYRWPVHRLREDYQPTQPPDRPTHLVIVRNRRDEISFLELGPLAKVLLDQLQAESNCTGLQLAEALADALPQYPRARVIESACNSLREFRQRDIVLGTVPAS